MSFGTWTYPTDFGTFKTTQIMSYYDRPLLFIAEDNVGTKYFGYLIDEDEHKSDTILFTPMSENRINELLSGKISIRKALVESENGWGFECFYPSRFSDKKSYSKVRFSQTLKEDEVPDEDVYLEEANQ